MDPRVKLDNEQGDLLHNPKKYRRLVGKLNYLTITPPYISFVVSVVSQFMRTSHTPYWQAVLQTVRYLKRAPSQGLVFRDRGHLYIFGYSDADCVKCPIDRHSTSGYYVFLGGNLVSWKSKKQPIVSHFSAKAEYRAMTNVPEELQWIRMLLAKIGLPKQRSSILHCDN
ncbi:hypothetical protein CFOL_v3_14917 [Cephalotus follicularis]|uniref:RVT_2 domain-containing protein n=1 Tax=Cephalotus follicularis TaxID=3775 RepID=A0A1Q3BUJ8_CEPFO|nr:hypothetical protein CFOL_v3_14917 [Cephalotus follicularis]